MRWRRTQKKNNGMSEEKQELISPEQTVRNMLTKPAQLISKQPAGNRDTSVPNKEGDMIQEPSDRMNPQKRGIQHVFSVPRELESQVEQHIQAMRQRRMQRRQERRQMRQHLPKATLSDEPDAYEMISDSILSIPPDPVLEQARVTRILTERLHGLTLGTYYDTCWSDKTTLYKDWLIQDDKFDVQVGLWHVNPVVHPWDGETYDQMRTVTYQYRRDPDTLGYALGQPVVHVTQTQYYRFSTVDSFTRSVLTMTLSMKGEVYSDSFRVHIRGVATAQAGPQVWLDFGVATEFTHKIMLQRQVQSIVMGATEETVHDLYRFLLPRLPSNVVVASRRQDSDLLSEEQIRTTTKLRRLTNLMRNGCWFPRFCCPGTS